MGVQSGLLAISRIKKLKFEAALCVFHVSARKTGFTVWACWCTVKTNKRYKHTASRKLRKRPVTMGAQAYTASLKFRTPNTHFSLLTALHSIHNFLLSCFSFTCSLHCNNRKSLRSHRSFRSVFLILHTCVCLAWFTYSTYPWSCKGKSRTQGLQSRTSACWSLVNYW